MKKILSLILTLIISLLCLASCNIVGNVISPDSGNEAYLYESFTITEEAILNEHIGEIIPFAPTNEYYFRGYSGTTDFENGVNYYTVGNSYEEFLNYRETYSSYELSDVFTDESGDTWYIYTKGDITVKLSYYQYNDDYVIDVFVCLAKEEDSGDNNDNTPDSGNGGNTGNTETKYTYTSFTTDEKNLFTEFVGEVIPFAPNNEYYVEEDYDDYYEADYITFYTYGNTQADFDSYRTLYSAYELVDSFEDTYGDTWYCYEKGCVYVEMAFYYYEGDYVIDVYVYCLAEDGDDNVESGNGGSTDTKYTNTSFTTSEKNLFNTFVGEVIPFAPNNEYYVEEGYDDYYEADYISFYTFGNTQADFNSYRTLYSAYELVETFQDTDGDTWYCYEKGHIYVEMAFYYYEGDYVIDVYVYCYADDSGDSGNSGNSGGASLPEGTNGVYDVDFTKAENVKDVTDQGYYIDGCPTTGSPAVLVIPVEFSDITASSRNMSISDIEKALTGDSDYYNLYDYYYISSGGQLTLDITILESWFRPSKTSSYYENATIDYYGDEMNGGDMLILDEALDYLDDLMDLSKFDSDNNYIIDSIILVTTLAVGDDDFHWAYRYWNVYTDEDGYFFEYDGVSANDYIWMSCEFFYESTDASGNVTYTDRSVSNPYTAIHEVGHVLGLDDYYDTSAAANDPMEGLDMMDAMTGDHNPFSKINLGWITTSRLVTDSVTLTLEKFEKNGDTIIIANNFDPTLGAYQEYYIICYYTNTGLNAGDDYGFFLRDGIVVYHINASLYSENYDGEIYYDIANNNTDPSDEYGTEDNLIELVKCVADTYTYVAGDKLPTVTDDNGNKLSFSFTVDSIDGDYATITFTLN